MGVYSELLEQVQDGSNFKVDFRKRSLKVGNRYLIRDGIAVGEIDIPDVADPYMEIQRLYDIYKYSVPSRRSQRTRNYFVAVDESDLTIAQLCAGEERELAKAMLEGYVLCAIVKGDLKWWDDTKYYWHGNDGLIMFREWIKGE